jgi:hypothetical protein
MQITNKNKTKLQITNYKYVLKLLLLLITNTNTDTDTPHSKTLALCTLHSALCTCILYVVRMIRTKPTEIELIFKAKSNRKKHAHLKTEQEKVSYEI